jgi:hypothetical protein
MCGIVGVFSKHVRRLGSKEFDSFTDMLVADAVRGRDSTGVFSVDADRNAHIVKIASHPFNLLQSSEYTPWRSHAWASGFGMIGHNRKATEGSISNYNAHPFNFGPICLVHNGHISNFRSLIPIKKRNTLDIQVDSHGAAYLLATHAEEPQKILKEMRGAFAFVWYNALQKSLYLLRNDQRPLHLIETEDSIFLASEGEMLRWILHRNSVKLKHSSLITLLKPGVLAKIDLSNDDLKESSFTHTEIELASNVVYHHVNRSQQQEVADCESAIEGVWRSGSREYKPLEHKIVTLNDGEMKEGDASFQRVSDQGIPEEFRFNIHYGHDRPVVLVPGEPLQIVWSIEDYKYLQTDRNNRKIYQISGRALNSKKIIIKTGIIVESDEELEDLISAPYLISIVRRVKENQTMWVKHPQKSTVTVRVEDATEVIVASTMQVEMMELGRSKLPVTTNHGKLILSTPDCACDPDAKNLGEKDTDGVARYSPTCNEVMWFCSWCEAADHQLKLMEEQNETSKNSAP